MANFLHRDIRSGATPDAIAVLGLGRFGSAVALELESMGVPVLGVDVDHAPVQAHADLLTKVVVADVSNETAFEQLGIADFDRVIVAISKLDTSVLTASLALSAGVPHVWAKASTSAHGKILTQLGVHHVVFPDADTGKRTAHVIGGNLLDYQAYSEDFVILVAHAPAPLLGKPLKDSLTSQLHVVALKNPGGRWHHASGHEIPHEGDIIMVTGPADAAERFTRLQ